jgi:hypothetical protein
MVDAFDATLNKVASIQAHVAGSDDYGSQGSTLVTLATGVPVRVSLGRGRAHEFKADKQFALNYREVFMRPWYDSNGNLLSRLNWLLIDGELYNVYQVDNPGGLNHHLEVWCTLVIVQKAVK